MTHIQVIDGEIIYLCMYYSVCGHKMVKRRKFLKQLSGAVGLSVAGVSVTSDTASAAYGDVIRITGARGSSDYRFNVFDGDVRGTNSTESNDDINDVGRKTKVSGHINEGYYDHYEVDAATQFTWFKNSGGATWFEYLDHTHCSPPCIGAPYPSYTIRVKGHGKYSAGTWNNSTNIDTQNLETGAFKGCYPVGVPAKAVCVFEPEGPYKTDDGQIIKGQVNGWNYVDKYSFYEAPLPNVVLLEGNVNLDIVFH